jgi:hypothetical protein
VLLLFKGTSFPLTPYFSAKVTALQSRLKIRAHKWARVVEKKKKYKKGSSRAQAIVLAGRANCLA